MFCEVLHPANRIMYDAEVLATDLRAERFRDVEPRVQRKRARRLVNVAACRRVGQAVKMRDPATLPLDHPVNPNGTAASQAHEVRLAEPMKSPRIRRAIPDRQRESEPEPGQVGIEDRPKERRIAAARPRRPTPHRGAKPAHVRVMRRGRPNGQPVLVQLRNWHAKPNP
jgi:hypothetical protein